MSECTHDCSTCSESCGERKEANVFEKKPLHEGCRAVSYTHLPSSIGISPLTTSHRRSLQRTCVRSSMRFYAHFNLLMVRSPGFGSMATNFMRPIQTRSRFASGTEYLKLARY